MKEKNKREKVAGRHRNSGQSITRALARAAAGSAAVELTLVEATGMQQTFQLPPKPIMPISVPSPGYFYSPIAFGPNELRNRIVMAPLPRSRAPAGDVPAPLAAEYYRQRASAGLIAAEATQISPQGKGYAPEAAFDGVEIHAANGYLIDQFMRDGTNLRADAYGGAVENRCRLLLEVVAAAVGVWGADRIGVRASPLSLANDIADSDPAALSTYAVEQLNPFQLLHLHVIEGVTGGLRTVEAGFDPQVLRLFNGLYIGNIGYDRALAIAARQAGCTDLVAFGRLYISNPDLVERISRGLPLAPLDPDNLYGGGAQGYKDYPSLRPH